MFIVKLKYEENILANTVETIIGTVPLLIPIANAIHSIIWNNPISTINDDNDDSKYLKNEPNITLYIFNESFIGLKCVSALLS